MKEGQDSGDDFVNVAGRVALIESVTLQLLFPAVDSVVRETARGWSAFPLDQDYDRDLRALLTVVSRGDRSCFSSSQRVAAEAARKVLNPNHHDSLSPGDPEQIGDALAAVVMAFGAGNHDEYRQLVGLDRPDIRDDLSSSIAERDRLVEVFEERWGAIDRQVVEIRSRLAATSGATAAANESSGAIAENAARLEQLADELEALSLQRSEAETLLAVVNRDQASALERLNRLEEVHEHASNRMPRILLAVGTLGLLAAAAVWWVASRDSGETSSVTVDVITGGADSDGQAVTAEGAAGADEMVAGPGLLDHVGTDGNPPRVPHEGCNGAVGLCLGAPAEGIRDELGVEDERYAGMDGVARTWYFDGWWLGVESSEFNEIVSLSVRVEDGSGVSVSASDGLMVGVTSVGDHRARLGYGSECYLAGEGVSIYRYVLEAGPEGSEVVEFGTSFDWNSETRPDPDSFGPEVDSAAVSSFGIGYRWPLCDPAPS